MTLTFPLSQSDCIRLAAELSGDRIFTEAIRAIILGEELCQPGGLTEPTSPAITYMRAGSGLSAIDRAITQLATSHLFDLEGKGVRDQYEAWRTQVFVLAQHICQATMDDAELRLPVEPLPFNEPWSQLDLSRLISGVLLLRMARAHERSVGRQDFVSRQMRALARFRADELRRCFEPVVTDAGFADWAGPAAKGDHKDVWYAAMRYLAELRRPPLTGPYFDPP